jgi:hypothetical protein
MNKQLIIHIAAELLIIGTVTFLINKRITKLETIIASHEINNTNLIKKVQMLETIVLNQSNQLKQLMTIFQTNKINLNHPISDSTNLNKREQTINFSPVNNSNPTPLHTPSFSSLNPLNLKDFNSNTNPLTSMFSQLFSNNGLNIGVPIIEMEVPLYNPNTKFEKNVEKGQEFEIINDDPKVVVEDEDEKKLNTISEEDEDQLIEESLNRILEEATNDEKVIEN